LQKLAIGILSAAAIERAENNPQKAESDRSVKICAAAAHGPHLAFTMAA
jgi:hypothetical protein